MDTKGGRITLKIGSAYFSPRGKFGIMPARATPTTGVNHDGSGFVTVEAQLVVIELSLDRGNGVPWTEKMLLEKVNVTVEELDVGVIHFLTKGNWDGRPNIDSATGEVSGMKVASDQYRRTSR